MIGKYNICKFVLFSKLYTFSLAREENKFKLGIPGPRYRIIRIKNRIGAVCFEFTHTSYVIIRGIARSASAQCREGDGFDARPKLCHN